MKKRFNNIETKYYIGYNNKDKISSSAFCFLLGRRNNRAIFDINKFNYFFIRALLILSWQIKQDGHLLVVNTNSNLSSFVKNIVESSNKRKYISYSHIKWVGGLLTNWNQLSPSIGIFSIFSIRFDRFLSTNNIHFPRYKKMKKAFFGLFPKKLLLLNKKSKIKKVSKVFKLQKIKIQKPTIIFLINPEENQHIIMEANQSGIPVLALVDSDSRSKGIDFPIPGNSESLEFIHFSLFWMIRVINGITSK